jgi:putative flippase GtrA
MTTKRFLVIGCIALAAGIALLALGSVLDSAAVSAAGAACVLSLFILRERWLWSGAGKQRLLMLALLASVVLVAFVAERLS